MYEFDTTRHRGSFTIEPQEQAPVKKGFWTKKKIIAGAAAAAILVPSAAYAAINIFGFGSITAAEATNAVLTIDDQTYPTQISPVLAPGQNSNVKIAVKNTNPFPVKVNGLIVKTPIGYNGSNTAAQCDITVKGDTVNYPKPDGSDSGVNGKKTTLTTPVNLNAGQVLYVEFNDVFEQASTADKICTVAADFAVTGTAGS